MKHFMQHSLESRRIACRRSRSTTINNTTPTYHHHHYRPSLTEKEVGKAEFFYSAAQRWANIPRNSVTLLFMLIHSSTSNLFSLPAVCRTLKVIINRKNILSFHNFQPPTNFWDGLLAFGGSIDWVVVSYAECCGLDAR